MISETCFTKEWLDQVCEKHGYKHHILAEKTIRAFELLVRLQRTGLPFVFKGGTSLLLHLPEIQRLSIDIDIVVTGANEEEIERAVAEVEASPRFKQAVKQDRGIRGLPNRDHFKLFYNSVHSEVADSVLLDVVYEPEWELQADEKPVAMAFLEMEEEVLVRVPTVESLAGDKLTAFAPHTLGVPYKTSKGYGRETDVAKQLFDVGALAKHVKDWTQFQEAYDRSYAMENGYRDTAYTRSRVLQDSIDCALDICGVGITGYHQRGDDIDSLFNGIRGMSNHLVQAKFTRAKGAKTAAAKVFALANTLNRQDQSNVSLLPYTEEIHADWVKDVVLEPPLASLVKIRKVEPEAVYYLAIGLGLRPLDYSKSIAVAAVQGENV